MCLVAKCVMCDLRRESRLGDASGGLHPGDTPSGKGPQHPSCAVGCSVQSRHQKHHQRDWVEPSLITHNHPVWCVGSIGMKLPCFEVTESVRERACVYGPAFLLHWSLERWQQPHGLDGCPMQPYVSVSKATGVQARRHEWGPL